MSHTWHGHGKSIFKRSFSVLGIGVALLQYKLIREFLVSLAPSGVRKVWFLSRFRNRILSAAPPLRFPDFWGRTVRPLGNSSWREFCRCWTQFSCWNKWFLQGVGGEKCKILQVWCRTKAKSINSVQRKQHLLRIEKLGTSSCLAI